GRDESLSPGIRGVSDGECLRTGGHRPPGGNRLHLDLPLRLELPRDKGGAAMTKTRSSRSDTTLGQHIYHLVLWLIAMAFFLPVLWIFLAAFKSAGQLVRWPPSWFFSPTFDNIRDVFNRPNFWDYFRMSFILSIGAVVIALVVSFLAAYCFSRFKPRGT